MGGAASARRRAFSLGPGDRIGRYVCVCPLAMGGMAELHVVAREDEDFGNLSVVKRMLPHLAADPEFATMFLKEARLARGLHHPNITQLLEFGEDDGDFFIILEYVHGYDLRQLIRSVAKSEAAIPLGIALGIAIDVCAGLHHAHEHRDASDRLVDLVHRDVTPSNVLLGLDGRVLLTDFGIARALTTMKTTRAGVIKGKLGYMSPEQCRDAHIDRRSDVFSVGVLLYEMTTGFRMFHAGNDFAVLNKIAKGEYVQPSKAVEGYPAALQSIVAACVAVDPERRPASAAEVRERLEELLREAALSSSVEARAEFVRTTLGGKERPVLDPARLRQAVAAAAGETVSPRKRAPWPLVAAVLVGGVVGGAVVTASGGPEDAGAAPSDDAAASAGEFPLASDATVPAAERRSQSESVPTPVPKPGVATKQGDGEELPTDPTPTLPPADVAPSNPEVGPTGDPAVLPPVRPAKPKTRRKKSPKTAQAPDVANDVGRTILPPSMRGN